MLQVVSLLVKTVVFVIQIQESVNVHQVIAEQLVQSVCCDILLYLFPFLIFFSSSLYLVLGCVLNLCQNGGLCQQQTNGYICICPSGYTGQNCQNSKLYLIYFKNIYSVFSCSRQCLHITTMLKWWYMYCWSKVFHFFSVIRIYL